MTLCDQMAHKIVYTHVFIKRLWCTRFLLLWTPQLKLLWTGISKGLGTRLTYLFIDAAGDLSIDSDLLLPLLLPGSLLLGCRANLQPTMLESTRLPLN